MAMAGRMQPAKEMNMHVRRICCWVATPMLRASKVLLGFVVLAQLGCSDTTSNQAIMQACTENWFRWVEGQVSTGDGQGHGPDLGSLEWRSVVEFKLGIRGDPAVPPTESAQWCNYINQRIVSHAT
jgi:hypothetical protein